MDVAAFLASCRDQWPGFDAPRALARSHHPRDRSLAHLLREIEGSATENKLMLLDLAARHLGRGEVYVEIGSWCGLSLAAAAHRNRGVPIYACDSFVRSWSCRATLAETIRRYAAPGQVRFYDVDFREFLARAPWHPARVGAYFYDAGHSFDEQYQALERMRPWLADDAIVIVDDTNDIPARAANRLFAERWPGLELVTDITTPADCDPCWWNGIQIYRHHATDAVALPVSPVAYRAYCLTWNFGVLVMQRMLTLPRWWGRRRWRMTRELVSVARGRSWRRSAGIGDRSSEIRARR